MHRKKDIGQSQANDPSVLVSRLQENSDQVEKNILCAEELLDEDLEKGKRGLSLTRRIETADNLAEAETLLKQLFMDVDKVKQLVPPHPQGPEIEQDVSHLHNRWSENCRRYRDLYKQGLELDLSPQVNWTDWLSSKQRQIQREEYGPNLSDVEKQIASHNILHKEIEAYCSQLDSGDMKPHLFDESVKRMNYLSSLYDYILHCNKEISYLSEQQDRIRKTDWSDLIRDVIGLRADSDRLKSNGIPTHETEMTKLLHEAEGLMDRNHPGTKAIKKYNAELKKQWQQFCNLCSCQEAHLDNVDIYKKFQLDAETVSESIKRINSTMEPSLLSNMSNSQILMQLEGEDRAVQRNERRLTELRELCNKVPPLPLRRAQYGNFSVVALCDWNTDKASINRKDKYTLLSCPRDETWEVKNSLGEKKLIPGVCFVIPPPDKDAIERVESLEQEYVGLKRRRTSLLASVKTQSQMSVSSVSEDIRSSPLSNRLDRLIADLLQLEKEVLERLRAPLSRADHTGDLVSRIRDHERAVNTLRNLEAEKISIQREIEPLLSTTSLDPSVVSYPPKLSFAKNKIEDLNLLTDLYGKKANAVKSLENQIKHVGMALIELEENLARDTIILDKHGALQEHINMLENLESEFEANTENFQKLNKNLELTEQLCGHLQKSFQEYCPDFYRQETEVRNLRNRYANISNQLQQRLVLIMEVTNKYNSFKSTVRALNLFLNDLPSNKLLPEDTMTLISTKQNSQKWAVEELKRKSDDIKQLMSLSHELQIILKEYEAITYRYRNTIVHYEQTDMNKWHSLTFADAIQNMERSIVKRYYELMAEHIQLLYKMELAWSIINKKDVIVNKVVVYEQREIEEVQSLKKELSDEISRRIHAENEIESYRTRRLSLKNRRGVERVEEIETVQYYRNPNLEAELVVTKKKIDEEISKHSVIQREIEIVNKKLITVDHEIINIKPKLLTKVMTEFARDPLLEKEALFIREEMRKMREEIRIRETEIVQRTTEITVLKKKAPIIRERVIQKEVVKVEKDPEMLKAVIRMREELAELELRSKNFSEEIFHFRSQIHKLDILIPTIQPQVVIKEVVKVEQDQALLKESRILRTSLEEISNQISILIKEISTLKVQYSHVETVKQRIEVREIVNEVYRISPETEAEIRKLRKEIQEWVTKRTEIENKVSVVTVDITSWRSQKPIVEVREVVNEIIKEERSPEMIKEMIRLKEKLVHLQAAYQSKLEKLTILRKERDEWQVERSKVQIQVVTRELIRYENDPLLLKELERLKKEIQEEIRLYRIVEENLHDLRQKYVVLENQKIEEKIIYQKIVVLQKDHNQIIEHEQLKKKLEVEMKSRCELEVEVKKWRAIILELEKSVTQTDVRQKKIVVETELRQIRSRILEFENAPPPEEKVIIEEVIKIERDAKMDLLIKELRTEIEAENAKVIAMERDIRNLKVRIDVLTKEKSVEKLVYKEVIRLERDQTVEIERDRLRAELLQLRSAIRNQEEEIQRVNVKFTRIQTSVTSFSKEETTIISSRDALLKEREELLRELKRLETERHEITLTFQHETKLLSEKTHIYKQKILRLEAEIESLEKDIRMEKEQIHQREITIIKLQEALKKEDHSETQTRETTKTTKITILDPETGKDMSAYDAYMQGFIDRSQYIHLQTLECSWEEITSSGPDGETSILRDCKSGKLYSIQEALTKGRLTQYDLQQYKEGKITISEFALKVAGEKQISSVTLQRQTSSSSSSSVSSYSFNSLTRKSSLSSSTSNLISTTNVEETFPISGVLDTTTKTRMSLRSAMTRKLIDPDTAMKLLEAQAATGGIVDLNKKERYSVHKSSERGLIEPSQMSKLLTAQKAFTGFEDPATKGRLSAGEALQRGWITNENVRRYMEAQLLTGGLVDPNKAGRVSLQKAIQADLIDEKTAKEIEDDGKMLKDLINPITKSRMTYKEAMAMCQKDSSTGLLLLPAASTDSTDSISFSTYQFSTTYTH
ncbi:envoplakin-like isoform X2 [Hemibagrus wyckioides]|uniref:envoplakin-like isoform X2 n=1 Tax=Hemibagrus wyckioides TaxID=337641 RepID=UPI00266CF585|nr:envoplakin-like isoform X2 [Hemibagrus wyckioides]